MAGAEGQTTSVTFLFTDIEGSTRMWEQDPVAMRLAIQRHDYLISEAVGDAEGTVVKERGEGDSVFAVFGSAGAAVEAAVSLQRGLGAEPWPGGLRLRVRVALHTGDVQASGHDYYGSTVNRCARLRSLAHGGQILLSAATAQTAGSDLPSGCRLRDLGLHHLKDLTVPERVHQLCHPDLLDEFPPLVAPLASGLPHLTTSFVGRDTELAELVKILNEHRFVTIVGAGGIGKTRLAVELALREEHKYPGGVFLVDVSPVTQSSSLPIAVASAMGVSASPPDGLVSAIVERLSGRSCLLIVDNCEHLVEACGRLAAELVVEVSNLRLLATSRQELGVYGELRWPLSPLDIGDRDAPRPAPTELSAAEQLFADRAGLARPGVIIGEVDRGKVVSICRQLDGLPLAIELAAARMTTMSVTQIEERVGSSLDIVAASSRVRGDRQRALSGVIGWSFDLLDEADQRLFRRLGVFAGAFDHAAAAAVAGEDQGDEFAVLEALERLVRRSLLVAEPDRVLPFRMLETIRRFARARMDEAGEALRVSARHAEFYVDLLRVLDRRRYAPDTIDIARAAIEDLRTAFAWLTDGGHADAALKLCWRVHPLWVSEGRLAEGRIWADKVLTLGQSGSADYGLVLAGRAWLAASAGDYPQARADSGRSLDIAERLGDPWVATFAHNSLGLVAMMTGEAMALRRHAQDQLEAARRTGEPFALGLATLQQGVAAALTGDADAAESAYRTCGRAFADCGDLTGVTISHINLGELYWGERRFEDAERELRKGEQLAREAGGTRTLASASWGIGVIAMDRSDWGAAARYLTEALRIAADRGQDLNEVLMSTAAYAASVGHVETGLLLAAGAEAMAPDCAFVNWGGAALRAGVHAAARAQLDDASRDHISREAAALDMNALVGLARHVLSGDS